MVCAAPKRSAASQPQHIVAGERFHWSGASASVEPGFTPARVSRAEAAQKRRICRAGAAWPLCFHSALQQEAKMSAAEESNGGFGFQTKVKDHFLNQRTWTCWYSCRENMQVLSATASLVLLFVFVLKSLSSLPQVTVWRLSLFFLILLLFDSSVFAKHSVMY